MGCVLLVCCRKIAEQRGPRAATGSLLPQADFSGGFTIRDEIERAGVAPRRPGRMCTRRTYGEKSGCGLYDEIERVFLREVTCPTSKCLHGDFARAHLLRFSSKTRSYFFFSFLQETRSDREMKSLIKYPDDLNSYLFL